MRPRSALLLLVGLALAGCSGLGGSGEGGEVSAASVLTARASGSADVLAPEVFQAAEPGLWDGRPSLGGVWVAHPRATLPERVRIVNRTNGQEVVGALFRRERDLPGPALQVSSDAAQALGMLAGAPAELEVIALRRSEAAPEPAEAVPAEGAPTGTEVADALDAAPAEAPPPEALAAEAAPAPAPVDPAPVDPAAAEAVNRATAAILAGAALATPGAAEPVPDAAPAPGAIATTTLDAPAGQAPAVGAAAVQSYVQLGQFDVESNATEAARRLTAQGLPAGILAGNGSWRLLLGPAADPEQEAALLQAAVAAGFADAYLVRL